MDSKISVTLIVAALALVAAGCGVAPGGPAAPAASAAAGRAGHATPADVQVRKGEALVEAAPSRPEGYNTLAAALMKKARETGDPGYNARAWVAVRKSLELDPENFGALGLRAALLLADHEFGEAVEAARRAQRVRPDDPDTYGVMADALVELGDYGGAIRAAQAMMDLRPDSASYARVAHLRALHGDAEGAAEAMIVALRAAGLGDAERVAWCRVRMSTILMNLGRAVEAERELDLALEALPDYAAALAAKGRARAIAGDFEGAVALYARAYERVPLPDTAVALGDLHARLGRAGEAARYYELAAFSEQAGARPGSGSRQLALLWAERDMRVEEALEMARRESAARSDIYTRDALAWCLYKSGDLPGARAAIDKALELGTRDAQLHYHAGVIYGALGDRRRAAEHLRSALEARVTFDNATSSFGVLQADAARRALARL